MMMGVICFAVSLRTLAGSSSGPVALFWFRYFQLLYYAIYADFEKGDVGVCRGGYLGDGVLFLGKYRAKFITIIYYWLVVYSKCGNANVFSFICLNK